MPRKLAFLSGAPRTSTKPIASATGPRQHVLGTISGFRSNGWSVDPYIVGDKVPESWLREFGNTNGQVGGFLMKRIMADAMRIALSVYHTREAPRAISQPDWVYERYGALQSLGYFFKRRGVPWILETNAPLFLEASSDAKSISLPALVRSFDERAYRTCDVLVVVSEDLKRIIVDRFGIDDRKILVVPNAADTELFDPEKAQPLRLFDRETFVVGFQGSMYKWAGLDYLIRAVSTSRAGGFPVAAVLLGDGAERLNLERLAGELGVSEYIRFPGRVPRDEVPGYIAGFDVAFSGQVPLSSNSMYLSPLKLYDYMSMGKPVIASRFSDAVSLIGHDKHGYLFPPGDLQSIVSSIQQAHSERAQLGIKGMSARAEVLEKHTWKARIRDLISETESLLPQPSQVAAATK